VRWPPSTASRLTSAKMSREHHRPNGSGKTATINLPSGLISQDEDSITRNGQRIDGLSTEQRAELGIARTFQNGRVYATMPVADNVYVGLHAKLIETRPLRRLRHVPVLAGSAACGIGTGARPTTVSETRTRQRGRGDQ